jgi:hypothetical protein
MKTITRALLGLLLLVTTNTFAQGGKEIKAGNEFFVTLPDYMIRTVGLNSSAIYQFKNSVKDVYGFIIEDNKEELKVAEMEFASVDEFYQNFIQDFLKDEERRKVSKETASKKGDVKFVESDVTYFDKDADTDIYYFVGIAETKDAYYKVLCWCTKENKDKFKADFHNLLTSIHE